MGGVCVVCGQYLPVVAGMCPPILIAPVPFCDRHGVTEPADPKPSEAAGHITTHSAGATAPDAPEAGRPSERKYTPRTQPQEPPTSEKRPKRSGLGELARTSLFINHPPLPQTDPMEDAPIAMSKPKRCKELGEAAKNSLFINSPQSAAAAPAGSPALPPRPHTAPSPRTPVHVPSSGRSSAGPGRPSNAQLAARAAGARQHVVKTEPAVAAAAAASAPVEHKEAAHKRGVRRECAGCRLVSLYVFSGAFLSFCCERKSLFRLCLWRSWLDVRVIGMEMETARA